MTYMTASQYKSSTPSHAIIRDLFSFTCPFFHEETQEFQWGCVCWAGQQTKKCTPGSTIWAGTSDLYQNYGKKPIVRFVYANHCYMCVTSDFWTATGSSSSPQTNCKPRRDSVCGHWETHWWSSTYPPSQTMHLLHRSAVKDQLLLKALGIHYWKGLCYFVPSYY